MSIILIVLGIFPGCDWTMIQINLLYSRSRANLVWHFASFLLFIVCEHHAFSWLLSNKLQGKVSDLRKNWWRQKIIWKILQSVFNSKNTTKFSDQGSRRQQADIAYNKDVKWIWITVIPWIPCFRSAAEIGPTLRPKATPHCGFKKILCLFSKHA